MSDPLFEILTQLAKAQLETNQTLKQSAESQKISHDQIMIQINALRQVVDRQTQVAQQQADTIQRFVGIVADQTRAVSDLSRTIQTVVEASHRSAQASESAAVLAQANQNAIRDLIEELRQARN